ncbi:Inner membrane protein YohD [Candidatus Rubidus massiliensis]|nr:MAG: alkaline phosphatase [Chlamydia sp. 32-24]CDZ80006.1 Inner membrane protein YohD [Candidatus Rubidus massiliensis]
MDLLPDNNTLWYWLNAYGSISLFFLLAVGIIALPVPEETLMVLAGTAMEQGYLPIVFTILAAYLGSVCGITVSYLLGKTFGIWLLHKYGKWFFLTEKKIAKGHEWFEKYGKWSLVIGYFIPGVRHFTGFIAGTAALEYKHFAFFAYLGAFFWVSTFLSIGYFFGSYGLEWLNTVEIDVDGLTALAIVLCVIIIFVYFRWKKS